MGAIVSIMKGDGSSSTRANERPPPKPTKQMERARTERATKIYNSSSMKIKWLAGRDMAAFYDIDRVVENHFVLEDEPFAFGATSEVFKCKMKHAPFTEYACKVIDKRKMFSRQRHRCNPGERLKAEIMNCSKLKHSHLIEVVDVFETSGMIFVIMELLVGGQLFNYVIERNNLSEIEAAKIVKQVTSAIAYMHAEGVLHRDLKAENILLKSADTKEIPFIKVVDFGMSKEVENTTNSVLGTPGYQAPEVMLGQKYTSAVDCFSLGALTYILLCGYMPLYENELQDNQTVKFPESEWGDISKEAKDFVSQLLHIDASKRMSCNDALDHSWLGLARDETEADGEAERVGEKGSTNTGREGPPQAHIPRLVPSTSSKSLKTIDFLRRSRNKRTVSRTQSSVQVDEAEIERRRKENMAKRSRSIASS